MEVPCFGCGQSHEVGAAVCRSCGLPVGHTWQPNGRTDLGLGPEGAGTTGLKPRSLPNLPSEARRAEIGKASAGRWRPICWPSFSQPDSLNVATEDDDAPLGGAGLQQSAGGDSATPLRFLAADESPRGVGGWLVFLCISLTILGPAFTILINAAALREVSWSALEQIPRLGLLLRVILIIELWLVVYSMMAGLSLWRAQPCAVQRAKSFLRWLLIARAVEVGLPFVMDLPEAAASVIAAESEKDLIRALIFVGIWHTYLNRSARVRNTFNDSDAAAGNRS